MAGINLLSLYGGNTSSIYNTIYNSNVLKYSSSSSVKSNYGKNISSTSPEAQDYLSGLKQFGSQLKTAAESITSRFPPLFQQMTAAVSNNDALSVTSVNSYASDKNKTTQVDISRIATTQKNEGNALNAAEKTAVSGSNQFSIESGGKTYDFNVNILSTDTNKAAQQKIADAINKKGIGVTASVSYDEKTNESSLVLESKETGEKNGFSITSASGGLMAVVGINNTTQEAQDALYSVNGGLERRSASNTVNLGNGITAELKKATEKSVDVDLKKDVNKIVNAVYDFVNNYNGLLETAKDFSSTGASKLVSQLTDAFKASSSGLARAGITQDSNGYIKIDTDKLKKAADNGSLESALGVNNKSSSYGFVNKVQQTARSVSANPAQHLGQAANSDGTAASSSGGYNYFTNSNGRTNNYHNYLYSKMTGIGLLFDSMF